MKLKCLGKNFKNIEELQEYVNKNEKKLTAKQRKEAYKTLATEFIVKFSIQQGVLSSLTTDCKSEREELMTMIAQALVDAQLVTEKEIENKIKEAVEELQKLEVEAMTEAVEHEKQKET